MVLTAALAVVSTNLRASDHLSGGDQALKAADAGLAYARSRLGEDYGWRGDGDKVVVSSDHLTIVEEKGNVIGIIRAADGEYSQFRIRFNYQDDASGDLDGFKDPNLWVRHPFVSYNNISGGTKVAVPRGDGANFSVNATSKRPHDVPPGTASIIVEARSGPGLANLGPNNLDPEPIAGQHLSSRVVEAYFRVNSVDGTDAAAQAWGDIQVDLEAGKNLLEIKDKSSADTPRLRSKNEIEVTGGDSGENFKAKNGETYTANGGLTANYDTNEITPYTEDPLEGFFKLTWDDVKKATVADDTVNAGTYVLWDDGTLHYYNMSYDDYKPFIESDPTNPGTVLTAQDLPESMELDLSEPKKPKLKIKGNTYVTPTGGTQSTDEFNLIPREGALEDPEGVAGPALAYTDLITNVQSTVTAFPAPTVTGTYAVTWNNIPLGNPQGNLSASDFTWNDLNDNQFNGSVTLVDNGDGTGSLTLDDNSVDELLIKNGGPTVIDQPVAALVELFTKTQGVTVEPTMMSIMSSIAGSDSQKIDLGTITDDLTPDRIEVRFEPEEGTSAIFSSEGNVRFGANVKGQGGSITSGGTIRLIGAGTDLSASIEDGLNLYAKGDIILSSLKEKNVGDYEFKDFKMKGVIYAWGDIIAKIGYDDPSVGKWGRFSLRGALVAYGGNPSGLPGTNGKGKIDIRARDVKLEFDPAYMAAFENDPQANPLSQTFYTVIR